MLDQHGLIVEVNRAWRQFGETNGLRLPDHGVGTNYLHLCLASEAPDAQEAARGIGQVLCGKSESHLQVYRCQAPDEERWFQLRVTRIPSSGHVMVAHEDVTDRKLIEQALRQQVEFVRGLVASSPDCIQVLDLDGTLLWMNEGGQRLMEIETFEAVRGQPWWTLWPRELHPDLTRALEAAREGKPGRFQGYSPTAKGTLKFWDVVVTPISGVEGQPPYLLATSRDLTALRKAEEDALHRAEETARILNSIQEGFFALDSKWRFSYLNARAEALLQRSAAELLGRGIWEAFPQALHGTFSQQYQAVVREQRSVCFQEYYAPLNMWFEVNVYPHGEGLAVYFQNITARKAEEQAHQDRNAILEMMVQDKALPEILDHIAQMVERQFPGHTCTIMVEQGGRLNLVAAPGLPPAFRAVLSGIEIREGAGICGTAVARKELVVAEDLLTEPAAARYLRQLPPHELRACVSLPILDGDEAPLGALALYATTPGPFSAQTLKTLNKARHLSAVAIERHRLTERLVHQAHHDGLTGLANRRLFEKTLRGALRASEQSGLPVSLLFIDLDEFKNVNDSLGHHVGDTVLGLLAERLRQCMRPQDTLARISGDEFTVVMPGAGEGEARAAAQRLLEALALPLALPGRELYLSASVGISVTPQGGGDAETMQKSADFAMYEAKQRKTGLSVFHPGLAEQASRRFELGRYLRRAIELRELEVHYQPIVQLEDQRVIGAEALLRWRHPELGLVSPAEFTPIAEETGLIVPIGQWVLYEACRQGVMWARQGQPPLRLAVNVSALQFERPDFVDMVAACLRETGFPAQYLELELTERVVMHHAEGAAQRMQQLRDLGVSIAVDDFGTGYSSLSYLSRLPLNVLKIDRSFVSHLQAPSSSSPVVRAIITLARSLGLETVAEGVETPEELQLLRQMGGHLAQGYLFARPLQATDPFWQERAVSAPS